jgi:hypothetical protein
LRQSPVIAASTARSIEYSAPRVASNVMVSVIVAGPSAIQQGVAEFVQATAFADELHGELDAAAVGVGFAQGDDFGCRLAAVVRAVGGS